MHAFYIKDHDVLNCPIPVTSSWHAGKILGLGQFVSHQGGWRPFLNTRNHFCMAKAYNIILGERQHVNWSSLVMNNSACPKAVFMLWLTLHRRLNTAVRISRWNPSIDLSCRICNGFTDSQDHLFGECDFAKSLWSLVFAFLAKPIPFVSLDAQIHMMTHLSKEKSPLATVIVRCWTEFVYAVWHHRNLKIFKGRMDAPEHVARTIAFRVACRHRPDEAGYIY